MLRDGEAGGGTLAALMVSLVLLALVLSGIAFLNTQVPRPDVDPDPMLASLEPMQQETLLLRDEVESLKKEVRDLRRDLTDLVKAAAPPPPPAPVRRPAVGDEKTAQRVSKLMTELETLKRKVREDEREREGQRRRKRKPSRVVADSQRQALDGELDAMLRVEALRKLRKYGGRTLAVALAMMELFGDCRDGDLRADILRNLNGLDYPELVQGLLQALGRDEDGKVREEAAETLGGYLGHETVRWALEEASRNDPSEVVRSQARASLGGGNGKGD